MFVFLLCNFFYRDCQLSEAEYSAKGWPPADGGEVFNTAFCTLYHHIAPTTDYAAYSVSKVGVNRLTELLAEKVATDTSQPRVLINAVSQSLYTA